MPSIFQSSFERIKDTWMSITMSQRMIIGVLATVLTAAFIFMMVWLGRPEYSILYSKLNPEDADRVVKSLEAKQVPYTLSEGGTVISVPADKVYNMRISLAGENVLTGQGVGFEIFDEVKVGVTDFVQKLNYRRALEGELARTIAEFPSIESARVHLVVPNRTIFIEEQLQPSASVLLSLSGSKKLDAKDVQAIVNLVTMSVEGLDKGRVSIADTSGKVLFQPDEEGSVDGLTRTQFDFRNRTQQNLERRIEELLMPVVGAGRVIARVNADLDFSQRIIEKELFDPEKTVIASEQRMEESQQGQARLDAGVADPNFRGDALAGNNTTQQSTREQRKTNYQTNNEKHRIVGSQGEIQRLTIAVVVDGTYEKQPDGTSTFVPRTEAELRQIRQLVANAVGYDSARGDTIEISNIAFTGVDIAMPESTMDIMTDYAIRFGKPLLNAFLVFLFLVMVVRPVVLALIRPKVEGRMIEELEGLPQADERLALMDDETEALAATAVLDKIEDIKLHSLQLSEQNMDQAFGIIKSWLREPSSGQQTRAAA